MIGWGDEDDEGPDPDYGVFGDAGQDPIPTVRDLKREIDAERRRIVAERQRRVSQDFNSHMIYLFNRKK